MSKTVSIIGSVDKDKLKEQIKADMQNLSDSTDASNVDANDYDIDGLQVNIGNCKIDLLAGLKRKPTKNNTFQFDLTCGLKKKKTKSKIKESLAELGSKKEDK